MNEAFELGKTLGWLLIRPHAAGHQPVLSEIEKLYSDIDKLTKHLCRIHADRIQCRHGCSACCVDDITVYEVEAQYILSQYPDVLKTAVPHPSGACAFLDGEGICRIYAYRPYVCRTQGLPLRWMEELPERRVVEMRDICPLNDPGEPIVIIMEDTLADPDPKNW